MDTIYTLEDYEKARIEYEYWAELWTSEYSEKQPNKFDAEAKQAADNLNKIEKYLKSNGLLAYSEDELAQKTLNEEYPDAKSRDIEVLNGVRYQKRFLPKTRSKSGKQVKEWHSWWKNLDYDV